MYPCLFEALADLIDAPLFEALAEIECEEPKTQAVGCCVSTTCCYSMWTCWV
jgi:hypothetical protein